MFQTSHCGNFLKRCLNKMKFSEIFKNMIEQNKQKNYVELKKKIFLYSNPNICVFISFYIVKDFA